MTTDRFNKRKVCILLFFLFVFHLVNNLIILKNDTTPITYDSFIYFNQSVNCYRALFEEKKTFAAIAREGFYSSDKPPLYSLVNVIFMRIFGVYPDVFIFANTFFLIILIIALYLLGSYFGGSYAGVLAAFIATMYPIVFGFSRWCTSYFAALALVPLAIYLFLRSDSFLRWRYLICGGICAGLCALTHPSTFFSLISVYVFIFVRRVHELRRHASDTGRFVDFFMRCAIAGFIPLCMYISWWVITDAATWSQLENNHNTPQLAAVAFGIKTLLFFMLDVQLHWFHFANFVIASLLLLRKNRSVLAFCLLWYMVHVFLQSFFPSSNGPRHTLAALPAFALATAVGFSYVRPFWVRRAYIVIIILVSLGQYLLISYSPYTEYLFQHLIPLRMNHDSMRGDEINHYGLLRAHDPYWEQDEIIGFLLDQADKSSQSHLNVWIIWGKPVLYGSLRMKIFLERLPIHLVNAGNCPMAQGEVLYTDEGLEKQFMSTHYVLTYRKKPPTLDMKWIDFLNKVKMLFEKHKAFFVKEAEFKLPDGAILDVYKNVNYQAGKSN